MVQSAGMPERYAPDQSSRPNIPSRARAAALMSVPAGTDGVRLALLAAILYNPLILVGYLLYLYGPSGRCVAGPLCDFGDYPGFLQIVVLLIGVWLLWLLLVVGVRRVLEAPGWHGRLTRWLRALSDHDSVRELLGVYAVALILALVVALLAGDLTPTTLILGAFTAGVSVRAALIRDEPGAPAAVPVSAMAREDTPQYAPEYAPQYVPPYATAPRYTPRYAPPSSVPPSAVTPPATWEGQEL
ncbi:MAG: hypothetical protein IVW57_17145 [Ktedonobacterales bacterium]|nr:hypothetical protein [Ktedonobacterales bacterium]